MTEKSNIIRSCQLQSQLDEKGYCVINWDIADVLTKLEQTYYESGLLADRDTYLTLYCNDVEMRTRIQGKLRSIIQPVLETFFIEYKILVAAYIIKPANSAEPFYIHQDPTIVDERKYIPVNMWIPLQDAIIDNGTLWVLEKSHKLYKSWRAPSLPHLFEKDTEKIKPLLKPVEVRRGQILFFDPRLVHMSGVNKTVHQRVVAYFTVAHHTASIMTPVMVNASNMKQCKLIPQPDNYFDVCTDFLSGVVAGRHYDYSMYETIFTES